MPKKILIIDDELEICKMVTECLFDAGYAASLRAERTGRPCHDQKGPPLPWYFLISACRVWTGLRGHADDPRTIPRPAQWWSSPAHGDTESVKKMAWASELRNILTKPIHLETLLDQFVRDMIGKP